ncbi:hypothetical protein [Rhodopirellula bahusiensis]|uniref:hypothetical protein n=1 Tax=Rhodopirellula bahusiensis TaxID=2014065 RepID=UPI003263BFC4
MSTAEAELAEQEVQKGENRNNCKEAVSEMDNNFIERLIVDYQCRLDSRFGGVAIEEFPDLRRELEQVLEDRGDTDNLCCYDIVFERTALSLAFHDSAYVLVQWGKHSDELGRSRLRATFSEASDSWARLSVLRDDRGADGCGQYEILTPIADRSLACVR